ncbi:MAG: hypothetical protein JW861_12425 [Bacteroidales bacterium]|nr:hypothetical protein [Bacteroidales bacterium]
MEARIELIRDKGYPWHHRGKVSVKGYLTTPDGRFHEGDALAGLFSQVTDAAGFGTLLKTSGGLFSIVIRLDDAILAATDRIRMFPLFFTERSPFVLSDDAAAIMRLTGLNRQDDLSCMEFRHCAYVTGNRTLISGIRQMGTAMILRITGKGAETRAYADYLVRKTREGSVEELRKPMADVLVEAFQRTLAGLKDRPVAVALSGGYDSRLAALTLKSMGFRSVTCFTYGRRGSHDTEISRKVAENLGFEWHYIPYDKQVTGGFPDDPVFRAYYPWSANHASMFYMQEFFAMKRLTEQRILPSGTVIIPGHSGDFLGGSHLDATLAPGAPEEEVIEALFIRHYRLTESSRSIENKLRDLIRESLPMDEGYLPHSLFEQWDLEHRQARFVVNSCNICNFFGFEHRLPFWERGLIEFCKVLPFHAKLGKKLYDDVLVRHFFGPAGLVFPEDRPFTLPDPRRLRRRKKLQELFPQGMIRRRLTRHDPICYSEVTREMIRDMKARGVRMDRYYYFNAVITRWYLEAVLRGEG